MYISSLFCKFNDVLFPHSIFIEFTATVFHTSLCYLHCVEFGTGAAFRINPPARTVQPRFRTILGLLFGWQNHTAERDTE